MNQVGIIPQAAQWIKKLVVSHQNRSIQAGNDPIVLHSSDYKQLVCACIWHENISKSTFMHAQMCSTNNETSRRYFSSNSTNTDSSWHYLSSS